MHALPTKACCAPCGAGASCASTGTAGSCWSTCASSTRTRTARSAPARRVRVRRCADRVLDDAGACQRAELHRSGVVAAPVGCALPSASCAPDEADQVSVRPPGQPMHALRVVLIVHTHCPCPALAEQGRSMSGAPTARRHRAAGGAVASARTRPPRAARCAGRARGLSKGVNAALPRSRSRAGRERARCLQPCRAVQCLGRDRPGA
jgi:hypothetical protein